jgi:hypothetical protein
VSELPSLASTKAEGLPKHVKAASAEPVETLSRQLDHEADRVEELFALAESR